MKIGNIVVCAPRAFAERCVGLLSYRLSELGLSFSAILSFPVEEPEPLASVVECDYLLLWRAPKSIASFVKVHRAIFSLGAGVEELLRCDLAANIPLIKMNSPAVGADMADYVLAAVLSAHIGIPLYRVQQFERLWERHRKTSKERYFVGILGAGDVGSAIARCVARAGYPVRVLSTSRKSIEGVDCCVAMASRPEAELGDSQFSGFLKGLNLLVCALPLTPVTTGILSKPLFTRINRGAYVVNVGRGGHLNEQDLIEALDSGQVSGATLDVFGEEPLPATHEFWKRRDILLTPHIASMPTSEQCITSIAEKISLLQSGAPISGLVDRARGY